MNNKAYDLKKKIAFTAALLMVSHSFAAMPLSGSGVQVITAHAADQQQAKTNDPSVKDGNTAKDTPGNKAADSADATATTLPTEVETEATTTTTAAPKVSYTVSVNNLHLEGWELYNLAAEAFNGKNPDISYVDADTVSVKVEADASPKEEVEKDEKKYKLVSSEDGNLKYDAYCLMKRSIHDTVVKITQSDTYPGDSNYYKAGSKIELTTTKNYIFANYTNAEKTECEPSETTELTVNGTISLDYENQKFPNLSVRIKDKVMVIDVISKTFKLGSMVGCNVEKDNAVQSQGTPFKWSEYSSLFIRTYGKKEIIVSNGTASKRFTVEDQNWRQGVPFEKIAKDETLGYKQDSVLSFSAVDGSVNVGIYYDGSDTQVADFGSDVYTTSGKDYFNVPYLYNSSYYLYKYYYDGEVTVTDALSQLENGQNDLAVPYDSNHSDIRLVYKKITNGTVYDYSKTSDVDKRNDNCYTVHTDKQLPTLIDFPADYYDQVVLYDELTDENKLKPKGVPVNSKNHYLLFPDNKSKYVFAKNLLIDETASLENSICFYNDKKSPEVEIRSKQESWNSNKSGSSYTFKVTDFEDPGIDRNGPLSYEQQEILRVYDNYINQEADNKEEIGSIIVGDYRFDKGSDGWNGTLSCRYENEAMREAKKSAVEALGAFSEYGSDNSSSYYESELAKGCSGIKKSISEKFDAEAAKTDSEEEIASLAETCDSTIHDVEVIVGKYNDKIAAESSKEASVQYYPTLRFNSDKSFTVVIKTKKAGTAIDIKNLPIVAIDNSGNISAPKTINVKVDGAAPVIAADSVKILYNGNEVEGDNVVLKSGYVINAQASDEGSGLREIYCYIDGSEKDVGGDSRKPMYAGSGGNYYHYVSPEEVSSETNDHSKDGKARLSFIAYDNVGNASRDDGGTFVSDKYIVIDTTAPECSISDASTNGAEQDVNGRIKKWYSDYSDIILPIKAFDKNPEICSGLKNITVTLNANKYTGSCDNSAVFNVTPSDGTDASKVYAEPLADGRYYITFEPSGVEDRFSAFLKRSDDPNVRIPVFENYSRGSSNNGNNTEEGSIRISISAEDYADLRNSETEGVITEAEVFIDLNDPEVASVDAYSTKIYERGTGTDGDKTTRFGHYSKRAYDAVIRIDDFGPSSGIDHIKADLYNADGSLYREDCQVRREGNNNVWFMSVPMDFKGEMRVVAFDRVGRTSTLAKTIGFITESGAKHNETSSMTIELPETEYRDRNGLPLYSSESVTAKITVKDSFSEIRNVTTNESDENEKHIYIDDNGVITGDEADKWRVTKNVTDRNLVPDITRDIVVSKNSNGNKISVSMTDNAENPDEAKVEEREFSIDSTDPKVEVKFVDGNGSADSEYTTIFKRSRKAVVTVTERNFDSERVDVKLNGSKQKLDWTHSGGTEGTDEAQYSAELTIEPDGVYELTASCTDMGNRASNEYSSGKFTIDRTEPALKVDFDQKIENGKFYKDSVVASFAVNDDNFDPKRIQVTGTYNNKTEGFPKISAWTQRGDSYVATIKFDKDGEYSVNITGTDKAGNAVSPYSGTFNVDRNSPHIKLADVKPANNGEDIKPRIIFNDPNINKDTIKITLEGANRGKDLEFDGRLQETDDGYEYIFDNIPNKETYDDIYTIRATAKDKAENRTDETFRFSVNRFGSTFMFDDNTQAMAGKYVAKAKDVVITEYNADRLAGDYSVFITKDGEMRELVEDKEYSVKVSGGDTTWTQYEYTIPSEIFEDDGRYTVSIHSTDEAGNINISASSKKKTELDFCVDKTEPLCIPINISENGAYKGDNHRARLSVSDNIMLKNAEVYIDGHLVDSDFSEDECVFDIPNSSRSQSVKIVLTDMADNKIEYMYKNILVTTNVARLIAHTTWFKVACGVLALAGGAFAALFVKRRRENRYR